MRRIGGNKMKQSLRKRCTKPLALILAAVMLATPTTAFAQTAEPAPQPAASVVYAPADLAAFSVALADVGYELDTNAVPLALNTERQADLSTKTINLDLDAPEQATLSRMARSAAPAKDSASSLKIMHISDTHLLAESMQPKGGESQQPGQFQPTKNDAGELVNTEPFEYPDFAAALHSDRKMMAESEDIDARVLEMVDESDPDVLVISGDLTKDGEEDSHKKLASMLEALKTENPGMQVYVINGNHDINNADATDFSTCVKGSYGSATTSAMNPDLRTTPAEFKEIYNGVSYEDAVATYTPPTGKQQGGLSYVARPADGFTFIVMDSGKYSADATESGTDEHMTAGALSQDLLNWAVAQTEEARARGDVVIGVEHHGLIPHFDMEPELLGEYLADNYEAASEALSKAGMSMVLTGHMHANDIASREIDGETFYDIETGSCVTYPSPVRTITLTRTPADDNKINVNAQIKTDLVEDVNYNGVAIEDFTAYGKAATELSGDMIGGAAGNLLIRPLVEKVLAAGGTKEALTALLGQDPGDMVISLLNQYLPSTQESGLTVTVSGIDATIWHAEEKIHIVAKISGVNAHLVIADSSIKQDLVNTLLQQVDDKVLVEGGLLDQSVDVIAHSVTDMKIDEEHTVIDLANYVYQGHLAGDEPQNAPDWVRTGIAKLRDVTLVNTLVATVVDSASGQVSVIADNLSFNATALIKGNGGFLDGLAAGVVANMVGGKDATIGKILTMVPVTVPGVEEPTNAQKVASLLNGLIDQFLTQDIKQQVGDFAGDVCESFIRDDNSATGGNENNGSFDFDIDGVKDSAVTVTGGSLENVSFEDIDKALLAIHLDDGEGPFNIAMNEDQAFPATDETAGLSSFYDLRVTKPLVIDGQGHKLGISSEKPSYIRSNSSLTLKNVELDLADTILISWKSKSTLALDNTVTGALKGLRDDATATGSSFTVDMSAVSVTSFEGRDKTQMTLSNYGTEDASVAADITKMAGLTLDNAWLSVTGDCTGFGTVSASAAGGGLVLTDDAKITALSGVKDSAQGVPTFVTVPAGKLLEVAETVTGTIGVAVTGEAAEGSSVIRAWKAAADSFQLNSPENMELARDNAGNYKLQTKETPDITGEVSITGTPELYSKLTADTSKVNAPAGTEPTYTYKWYRCDETGKTDGYVSGQNADYTIYAGDYLEGDDCIYLKADVTVKAGSLEKTLTTPLVKVEKTELTVANGAVTATGVYGTIQRDIPIDTNDTVVQTANGGTAVKGAWEWYTYPANYPNVTDKPVTIAIKFKPQSDEKCFAEKIEWIDMTITPKAITEDVEVAFDQDSYPFTGEAVVPVLTVTDPSFPESAKNRTLTADKDYTVSYQDNDKPGTATAVLSGIGNYEGSLEKTFLIKDSGEPTEYDLMANFNPRLAALDGETIANLTGVFRTAAMSGSAVELRFTPAVEGREFASVRVNEEEQSIKDSGSFVYDLTMPASDTILNFDFSVVDKTILRAVVETAEGLQGGDEYEACVPAVQKKFDKALEDAQAVAGKLGATQEEIDQAWNDMLNAIHLLGFEEGDPTALNALLEIVKSLDEDNFTPDTWAGLQDVVSNAEDAAESGLKAEIEKAYQQLNDALKDLAYRADFSELEALIAQGKEINLDDYLDLGDTKANFTKALENAEKIVENLNAAQKEVDDAATALTEAIAALRKTPSKDTLEELIGTAKAINTGKYTLASVASMNRALDNANRVLDDPDATEGEIKAVYTTLSKAMDNLVEKTNGSSSSGKKSSSRTTFFSNAYGAAGIVSANQRAVNEITLQRSQFYTVNVTSANGAVPAFTVGNGLALKTQFVQKSGNVYQYNVWAIGTPGQSAGVYTMVNGQSQKLCAIEIA